MSVSQRPRIQSSFDDAVAQLERSGREYLRRHRLPPEDADDILQQTLLTYLIKHDNIYDPEAWVRGALKKRCQFYWRRRQRNLVTLVDSAILEAISAPSRPDQSETGDVRRDLGPHDAGAQHDNGPNHGSSLMRRMLGLLVGASWLLVGPRSLTLVGASWLLVGARVAAGRCKVSELVGASGLSVVGATVAAGEEF